MNFGRNPVERWRPSIRPPVVLPDELVDEQVLHHDHVAFHADHFGHMGDAARAVAQARRLDDDVQGGRDLLAHRP